MKLILNMYLYISVMHVKFGEAGFDGAWVEALELI